MTQMNGQIQTELNFDEIAKKYSQVLERIKFYEDKIDHWKKLKTKLSNLIFEMLAATGQTGAKTAHGTIGTWGKNTASLADPEAFMTYVIQSNLWHLVERRANADACLEHADENEGQLPPGVKINHHQFISFTGGK
jgi:hypothetical protein